VSAPTPLDAVLDRIREIPALSEVVFDGKVVGKPQRYVLVHATRPLARPDRLAGGLGGRARTTIWVHSVGASSGQAAAVARAVLRKLRGWKPTLDGYLCEPITHEASEPISEDDSRQPVLYYGVDQLDLWETPLDEPAELAPTP
jgi:hypothetical protein